MACSVTDLQQYQSAIDEVLDAFGRVDVLVNNAGITQPLKLMDIKPENYEAVTDVSLHDSLYSRRWSRTCVSASQARSSVCPPVSAQRGSGVFGGPHYSAAKAGVLGLAKAMARELVRTASG